MSPRICQVGTREKRALDSNAGQIADSAKSQSNPFLPTGAGSLPQVQSDEILR
jgi:hypothetical protein